MFDARGCAASPTRIATWFKLDAPDVLADDPAAVATWQARGVTVFALVGKHDSALATSAVPSGPERPVGLTPAGKSVVQAVLETGALLDVSYLSDSLGGADRLRALESPGDRNVRARAPGR
ncbi:MAG TPA: membrane dipeptidase [Polyangiaceae bacterium]|nr:membrane dipeptidase [Polyangiaceae bacterium]